MSEPVWYNRLTPETRGVLRFALDIIAGRYPFTPIIGINYLRAMGEIVSIANDEIAKAKGESRELDIAELLAADNEDPFIV